MHRESVFRCMGAGVHDAQQSRRLLPHEDVDKQAPTIGHYLYIIKL